MHRDADWRCKPLLSQLPCRPNHGPARRHDVVDENRGVRAKIREIGQLDTDAEIAEAFFAQEPDTARGRGRPPR